MTARCRLASTHFPERDRRVLRRREDRRGEPKWANYCRGVAAELIAAGIPLVGMDALIDQHAAGRRRAVELGGDPRSAPALSLLTLAGVDMDPQRLALIAQKAEHEYADVPCGIMDQTIVAAGKAGHAMLLDCRDLSKQFIPIDANELRVVIVNTHGEARAVRRRIRRAPQAVRSKASRYFQKHNSGSQSAARRDDDSSSRPRKGKLDDVVFRRCRHVVTENAPHDRTSPTQLDARGNTSRPAS